MESAILFSEDELREFLKSEHNGIHAPDCDSAVECMKLLRDLGYKLNLWGERFVNGEPQDIYNPERHPFLYISLLNNVEGRGNVEQYIQLEDALRCVGKSFEISQQAISMLFE